MTKADLTLLIAVNPYDAFMLEDDRGALIKDFSMIILCFCHSVPASRIGGGGHCHSGEKAMSFGP